MCDARTGKSQSSRLSAKNNKLQMANNSISNTSSQFFPLIIVFFCSLLFGDCSTNCSMRFVLGLGSNERTKLK